MSNLVAPPPKLPVHVFDFGDAIFSECTRFRYRLDRGWPGGTGILPFLLLNPSTATATVNDNTITRCMWFARHFGYNGLFILNLFAFRGTDPRSLLQAVNDGLDPIGGHENDRHIDEVVKMVDGGPIVCGWGSHPFLRNLLRVRAEQVVKRLRGAGANLRCFDHNADGMPKHPLYLPKTSQLIEYRGFSE